MYPDIPFDLLNPSIITILQILVSFLLGAYCFVSIYRAKTQKKNVLFWLTLALTANIIISCAALFITPLLTRFIFYALIIVELCMFHITITLVILLYNEKAKLEYDSVNKISASIWNNFSKRNLMVWYVLQLLVLFFLQYGQLSARANLVADLPAALLGHYDTLTGKVESINQYDNIVDFFIVNQSGEKKMFISTNDFTEPTVGKTYTMTCLPNSQYVVNIIDESGKSLLQKYGSDVIGVFGNGYNVHKLDKFIETYKTSKADKIRIITYTIEGDPIFYDLIKNSEGLKLIVDLTRDKFGGGDRILKYSITDILKQDKDGDTVYIAKTDKGKDIVLLFINNPERT